MHEQGLKSQAQSIFMAGIKAVDPADCVHTCLHMDRDRLQIKDSTIFLNRINRLIVVGMGKASAAMAAAVESLLREKIDDGLIITKYGHKVPLRHCRVVEAAHPVPDAQGVAAADALINLVSTAGPDDVVLCLISGGGSALSPAPIQGLSLEDKQAVTRLLLACGATIQEINTIRKHLSRLKGGGLCRLAPKARVVSLTLSDVIGDDLDIIASGATVPDTGTFKDCMQIVQTYNLLSQLPHAVRNHLQQGCSGRIQETPKPGDAVFENTANHIVGSLSQALGAAEEKARSLGFQSLILTSTLNGEAREAGKFVSSMGREVRSRHRPICPPACILTGGETTVTIQGTGLGGRNMELALSAVMELSGLESTVLLSAGTDGTDGPTDAAGAFASGTSRMRAEQKGISPAAYLAANDSYHFFQQLDDLLITGPTGTNVMDMQILLVGK